MLVSSCLFRAESIPLARAFLVFHDREDVTCLDGRVWCAVSSRSGNDSGGCFECSMFKGDLRNFCCSSYLSQQSETPDMLHHV